MGAVRTLERISFELPGHVEGKVRHSWKLPDQKRLLVTTDRLSAFDRVLGLVQNKGQVLNQLAAWWFERTADIVPNHVIAVPDPNALIAVDATPLPVEVIVRARLTGSTDTAVLPRYKAGERLLYGYHLPDGIEDHGALPEPLITPTTKAEKGGHDRPTTVDEVASSGVIDPGMWTEIQKVALELFRRGTEIAAGAGFVLADTKYEFGLAPDGSLVIIDEMHTPDSSRFWAADSLEERLVNGLGPEAFDKEPIRLAMAAVGYRGEGTIPSLPDEVWATASARYVELYERITGLAFIPGAQPADERIRSNLAGWLDADAVPVSA